MPVFELIRELRNGKYETATNSNLSNNSETNPIMSAHETNTDYESETRVLSRDEDYEQIRI